MNTENRKWYNIELKGKQATALKGFLKSMLITYETSDAGFSYIHFQILCTSEECTIINDYLDSYIYTKPELIEH